MAAKITSESVRVASLGPRQIKSPLALSSYPADTVGFFVPDESRVRYQVELYTGVDGPDDILFEKAGPREQLFFSPAETRAAIVTCGGLCPGLNNVIRSAFLELHFNYHVKEVLGIRYGYAGLNPAVGKPPIRLCPELVDRIHEEGGTILGSSRGPQPEAAIVDFLVQQRINLLICVGGDGTQRGTHDIFTEVTRRDLPIAVVGIPKTIDNDLMYVWRSFGLSTAVEKADEVLDCAHAEARGALNGIGLVKLMGREAGFIAAFAALASQEVNFALIPEVPFKLEGSKGFLEALRSRLEARGHAVIVVAEGAGQDLVAARSAERDPSGNIKFGDIGLFLKDQITAYFKRLNLPVSLKYFDPSYSIRSVPANCDDGLLCDQLARHAVHAGMAGKTDVLIGYWHNVFTHLPIPLAVAEKKRVSPKSALWRGVLATTGQPREFV
jgi:6-phosphofructokinase 1